MTAAPDFRPCPGCGKPLRVGGPVTHLCRAPHNGTAPSKAAGDSIRRRIKADAQRILAFLRDRGPTGATCDEVEFALELTHQTASARLNGLMRASRIRPAGERPTRSGRMATVWVVAA